VEGSDDNPIKLPETPRAEIENLLRLFYFGYKTCHLEVCHGLIVNLDFRMHDDYVASLTDWISTLSISTRLIFEKVRERAIKEITAQLDQVEAFDLIGLAIKFDVEQWLKPAYRRIVTRGGLITHVEAAKVPFPMAVMLMRSREQFWKNNANNPHAYSGWSGSFTTTCPDTIIDAEIRLMVLEPTTPWRRSTARSASTVTAAAEHASGDVYASEY